MEEKVERAWHSQSAFRDLLDEPEFYQHMRDRPDIYLALKDRYTQRHLTAMPDGGQEERYMLFGTIHRDGGPAQIIYDAQGRVKREMWKKHGHYFRDDNGPAEVTYCPNGTVSSEDYYVRGRRRASETEPALKSYYCSDGSLRSVWYYDAQGRPHRTIGPARIIYQVGTGQVILETYYTHGQEHSQGAPPPSSVPPKRRPQKRRNVGTRTTRPVSETLSEQRGIPPCAILPIEQLAKLSSREIIERVYGFRTLSDYRQWARQCHPDKVGPQYNDYMSVVNRAANEYWRR